MPFSNKAKHPFAISLGFGVQVSFHLNKPDSHVDTIVSSKSFHNFNYKKYGHSQNEQHEYCPEPFIEISHPDSLQIYIQHSRGPLRPIIRQVGLPYFTPFLDVVQVDPVFRHIRQST